jgi:RNA polymerase sigma-70 factor, ECF subfamily
MGQPLEPDPLLKLHHRLLNGDRVASEELCQHVLDTLFAKMTGKFPGKDDQVIFDGVIEAVLDYCERPQQFDVNRRIALESFLATAAWRNISNLLRGEHRRKAREKTAGSEKSEASVVLGTSAGNDLQERQRQTDEKIATLLAALENPMDRAVLSLRLEGERSTAAFARILNVTHLPPHEQRAEVKRHKDRIMNYLRRKGLQP